jgi:chemotaxis signal transduction protein
MATNERKFLIFFMHGKRYAFDLAHVAEVMDPVISWPIPLAPSFYSGVINFHGAIVAVMDLAFFLGFGGSPKLEKIIVLDVNIASLGFLVERVARIVPEEEIEFQEAPDVRFASALLRLTEGNATLLDIVGIIREAEISING